MFYIQRTNLLYCRDQVLGVAAVDFSLAHLYHLLTQNFEQCNREEYRLIYPWFQKIEIRNECLVRYLPVHFSIPLQMYDHGHQWHDDSS